MTVVSDCLAQGPLNDGYGPKLECPSVHTGVMAAAMPWRSSVNFAHSIEVVENVAAIIVLQRDIGEGSVDLCSDGFNPGK